MTRITSAMMTNTTLMHINRNMRNLDEIIRQIETTQRMQRPSDDPIRASRAMKFQTNVSENDQFQRNVLNGIAWMNVTESTFTNINSELMRSIRELAVQGANDTLTVAQKQGIILQMQSFFNQVGHELNQTYAGNFLFSGFRTDEPPMFNRDNDRTFVITQHFSLSNVNREQSFQRLANAYGLVEPRTEYANMIRLAFRGLDTTSLPQPVAPATWHGHVDSPDGIHIPGFHVRKVSINDPMAYLPTDTHTNGLPMLHLIHETGELVMSDATAQNFPREGVSITYQKTGFMQGDINPAVYFTAREIITDPGFNAIPSAQVDTVHRVTQYFSREAAVSSTATHYTFELAFDADFAGMAGGVFNDVASALRPTFNPPVPQGQLPVGATFTAPNTLTIPASHFHTVNNFSITYSVENAPADIMEDLTVQGVELVRAISTDVASGFAVGTNIPLDMISEHRSFDMNDQEMRLEFAAHTHIPINSLAKNLVTDKMFADFRRLFEFSEQIHISERATLEQHFSSPPHNLDGEALERAVVDQLTSEEAASRAALFTKLNNMMFLIDGHVNAAAREQTLLGSRMVRLDLMHSRLEQDAVTFELLTRDNNATDIPRALIMMASAEAAFMASLRANSGIVQMSLAQFIS